MATTYTYDDAARREDLLDIITNLTPSETQLLSGLGISEAKDIIHQWATDTLKSAAYNGRAEGADASYVDRTDPTRLINYTQIVAVDYDVSDTERETNPAGFEDRFAYETGKALKEWKNDAEFALMRGTLACLGSTTPRGMRGLKDWLDNYNYTLNSGTSLTESLLNDALNFVWDDGCEVDALYVPMYMKRKISAFTAGATKNVETTDKRLVNTVSVYESDAARMVKIFPHRYITVSGDTNYDVIGIQEDMFKLAYLRKPKTRDYAKTGDSTKGGVVGELTLEVRNPNAGFYLKGML